MLRRTLDLQRGRHAVVEVGPCEIDSCRILEVNQAGAGLPRLAREAQRCDPDGLGGDGRNRVEVQHAAARRQSHGALHGQQQPRLQFVEQLVVAHRGTLQRM